MLIPTHKIEEVLQRVDLLALVQRNVSLKRSGRSYKGCCPFHAEKTPSFYVTPERHMWKCFGCGAGGDAIHYVMRQTGRGFVDSVRDLAREVSVDLEGAEDPAAAERGKLRQVNELAQTHFAANLAHPLQGTFAREHLASRSVSEASIRKFGLGWAPASWSDLSEHLAREGSLDAATRAGLVSPRPKGSGTYDVYRSRLMIPIRTPDGRTVAFGGRLLEGPLSSPAATSSGGPAPRAPAGAPAPGGPKYLNSRESPLYVKGDVLYGLDLAKDAIRRSGQAVLVEGYFDVIGLNQAGVENVVALSSTTLTERQLALLSRFGAKELVLLLDGDAAGVKAIDRLAGPILASAVSARVATLPQGQDPDDFAVKHGVAALQDLLARAVPLSAHLVASALPQGKGGTWEDKMAALRALRPVLEKLPADSLERSLLLGQLAAGLGVTELEVRRALASAVAEPPAPRPPPAEAEAVRPAAVIAVHPSEELLCALLLADPGLVDAAGADALHEVAHLGLRALVSSSRAGDDGEPTSSPLDAGLERRIQRKRGEILARWPSEPNRREAVALAGRQVRLLRVEERLRELQTEFARAGDDLSDDSRQLLEEQQRLRELRTRLTRPPDGTAFQVQGQGDGTPEVFSEGPPLSPATGGA